MVMSLHKSIVSKLGGHVDSNPEILSAYPPLQDTEEPKQDLISYCLPIGSKAGDFIVNKYNKNTILSYIFAVEKSEHRDDLFSFSVLIDKSLDPENYKPIIQYLIEKMREYNLLNEFILQEYQSILYEKLNEESDIEIEGITIETANLFRQFKKKKGKPDLKGSFF